jgi:hypothetical protein
MGRLGGPFSFQENPMPFNGSGTFSRLYNWVTDKANAVKITASRMDDEFDGIATALSNMICRDGQSSIAANIPFGGKKITALGDATADTDALNRQSADDRFHTPAATAHGSIASGTENFSLSSGPLHTITVAGNQTWAITNKPASDLWYLWIIATNPGAFTVTLPTISWIIGDGTTSTTFSNTGVTLQSGGVNQFLLWGQGSGTVYGKVL